MQQRDVDDAFDLALTRRALLRRALGVGLGVPAAATLARASAAPAEPVVVCDFPSPNPENWSVSPRFGQSGRADVVRPNPGGSVLDLQYTWQSGVKTVHTRFEQKMCPPPAGAVVEVFQRSDSIPGVTDIGVTSREPLPEGMGLDTGKLKNRFALACAIEVSHCNRFSFTNLITQARFRLFRDGNAWTIRVRPERLPAVDGGKHVALVWPDDRVGFVCGGAAGWSVGVFFDNPGFTSAKADKDALMDGDFTGTLVGEKRFLTFRTNDVWTDDTDFLTAIYCDVDNNGATPALRERGGAEHLTAIVKWGYEAKLWVRAVEENNQGWVKRKPVTILCEGDADFAEAKALHDAAYSNDTGIIDPHFVQAKTSHWELVTGTDS
jgi:hypothetical protein